MLTSEERRAMIGEIRRLPALVAETIKGMNDAQLDTPYGDGKWTARQVVHHLADSHMNGYGRMKLLLTENNPTVKTYDQEAWASTADVLAFPVASSLSILEGLHTRWAKLMESLSESDWQRTGNHPEHGPISIEWILKIYSGHGVSHMGKIADLRRAKGW